MKLEDQRHVWRDGMDGLVHIIKPKVFYDTGAYIGHWNYLCGGKTLSSGLRVREPDAIPSCLACIGAAEQ